MRLKRRTIYFEKHRYVLTYPADCEIFQDGKIVEITNGKFITRIQLDPIKPEISGNIRVSILTPFNYQIFFKPFED